MKHTGTIEIDCNMIDCDKCEYKVWDYNYCVMFHKHIEQMQVEESPLEDTGNARCPECLATFKPELTEGKVRQIMAGGSDEEMLKNLIEAALNEHKHLIEGE
jgi:hypothetical protein